MYISCRVSCRFHVGYKQERIKHKKKSCTKLAPRDNKEEAEQQKRMTAEKEVEVEGKQRSGKSKKRKNWEAERQRS